MKELLIYIVVSLLKFNGKYYYAGSEIELSEEEATPLLADGVIRTVDAAQAASQNEDGLAPTDTGTGKTDADDGITILEAIAQLDENNTDHYTSKGQPKTDALSELMGRDVSAAERDEQFGVYTMMATEKGE